MSAKVHTPALVAKRTAVLAFARTIEADAFHKSLSASAAGSADAHSLLRRSLHRTLRDTGLPTLLSTEATQRGDTFGERLGGAVADAFAQGFDHLVIVGGDCPGLRASDIRSAASALKVGQLTVGRDHRGGAFLISVRREDFTLSTFASLPWQTEQLADALVCWAKQHSVGAPLLGLRVRRDVNTGHDLSVVAAMLRGVRGWSRYMRRHVLQVVRQWPLLIASTCFGESPTLRGPPQVA